jgi:hypothetical protein
MATNYPTYAQPTYTQPTISNNLRTGAQTSTTSNMTRTTQPQTYTQPTTAPTYSTSMGMTQPSPTTAWDPNRYTTSSYPTTNPTGPYDSSRDPRQPTYTPAPLPGNEPIVRDGSNPTYYNPTYPTYTPGATGAPATANQFNYYQGLDPTTLQSNDEREAALQAVQANVPVWQLGQNAYQYSQDFNEAQRRWNEQFGYQQGLDTFNQQLSTRQQTMAEWQAQQASQQWSADYNRQMGNDAWNQQFSQQQFGLQDYSTRTGLDQQQQQITQQGQYQQGQLGIAQEQNRINEAYNQGRLTNEQRQTALAELTQGQNYSIQQGQLTIAQQGQRIDEMYRTGQLDLGQRNQALQELQNQQTYGMQQQQFGQVQTEQARRFGLDVETQTQLAAYRNAQLAQEGRLAQEQMAVQREQALLAAYGRNQRPNTRWMRAN